MLPGKPDRLGQSGEKDEKLAPKSPAGGGHSSFIVLIGFDKI